MIRKATVFDANELTKMWVEMCAEVFVRPDLLIEYDNPTVLFNTLVYRISSSDWGVGVYEVDGKIVGFMMSRVKHPQYSNCHIICECEAIYIYPEYRNKGIHKEFGEETIRWGKANNATQFEFSGPYSEVLIRFWNKLGYEPVIVTYRQKEAT